MNYSQYMRKIASSQANIIGYNNGQEASQITLKNQAKAVNQTTAIPTAVPTSFSQVGGTKNNILRLSQQNSSPTSNTCATGFSGVSQGFGTADQTGNLIGKAQGCAVCSDAPSSEPYAVTIPCATYTVNGETRSNDFISPVYNAPTTNDVKWCASDPGIKFSDNKELVADQGRQADLRRQYNLPAKLQGLRGPVVGSRY